MNKTNTILAYVLKDPSTLQIRYVGITYRSLNARFNGHKNDVKHRPNLNKHKTNWFKKLEKLNTYPIVEKIAEFKNLDDAKLFEIEYILKFKEKYKLINATPGGDSCGEKIHSRESILKKKTTRAVVQYDIFGMKIQEFEITEDAARKLKISSGSKITMCCKKYRRNAHGYVWRYKGEDFGEIENNPNSLDFSDLIQYDKNGIELKRFNSYLQASIEIGDKSKGGNIAACISGKQNTCKGYGWKTEYKLERGSL